MRALALAVLAGCSRPSSDHDRPCTPVPPAEMGDATYYSADGTGKCSFDASPADLMVAAMNGVDFANAAWCGACLAVTGPNGTIAVRVVDECPGCKHGDLDLSEPAFAMLAPPVVGRIPITWHEIACPVYGPIAYRFKETSSSFWTAIQVREHRYPIAMLEVQATGGAWNAIPRADYNYFVAESGLGSGPYAVRVTDSRGQMISDPAIALGDADVHPGAAQFPACTQDR
jgi:expansin (peptidoglycan-binding protein)